MKRKSEKKLRKLLKWTFIYLLSFFCFEWFWDRQKFFLFLVTFIFIIFYSSLIFLLMRYLRFVKYYRWVESKATLLKLKAMYPFEFEEFVADLFSRLGFITKRIGGPHDGGVDVIASKNGIEHFIQCKKYVNTQVRLTSLRDFYGAMSGNLNVGKGYFVTTNIFTLEAERFAEDKPIELIDGYKLLKYMKLAGTDSNKIAVKHQPDICPLCGGKLTLRTAYKGQNVGSRFYGCSNFPKCKYTRNANESKLALA